MEHITVLLIALGAAVAALGFLALRLPRGRTDWKRDSAETAGLLASALTFLVLFLLLWYLAATVEWPAPVILLYYGCLLLMTALGIVAIGAPEGLRIDLVAQRRP